MAARDPMREREQDRKGNVYYELGKRSQGGFN